MLLDFLDAQNSIPQPLRNIHRAEPAHDVLREQIEIVWVCNLRAQNLLVSNILGGRLERREPREHFEDQDPEGPEIGRAVVAFAQHDLWRHVIRRAAGRVRLRPALQRLAEPQVGQFAVPALVQENILWLEIPVHVPSFVDVLHREQNLRRVEPRGCHLQFLLLDQKAEQLTAGHVLHGQVEVLLVLEGAVAGHKERAIKLVDDRTLAHHVFYLVHPNQRVFFHHLHHDQGFMCFEFTQVGCPAHAKPELLQEVDVVVPLGRFVYEDGVTIRGLVDVGLAFQKAPR
mmetsp:Transcript_34883/g.58623  ORF Transcript_34883/g.58623 Transcript_34883/m.58623 type:complete len:286 (+) Transcript_34883:382-1239(+)